MFAHALVLATALATPEPVLPCSLALQVAAAEYITRGSDCDACSDGKAQEWSECRRLETLSAFRDHPDVLARLAAVDRALADMADRLGEMRSIQTNGDEQAYHLAQRYRTTIETGFAEVAAMYQDGTAAERTPRVTSAIDSLRGIVLGRVLQPSSGDLAPRVSKAQPLARVRAMWAQQAEEYRKRFGWATYGTDRGALAMLMLVDRMNHDLLLPRTEAAPAAPARRAARRTGAR